MIVLVSLVLIYMLVDAAIFKLAYLSNPDLISCLGKPNTVALMEAKGISLMEFTRLHTFAMNMSMLAILATFFFSLYYLVQHQIHWLHALGALVVKWSYALLQQELPWYFHLIFELPAYYFNDHPALYFLFHGILYLLMAWALFYMGSVYIMKQKKQPGEILPVTKTHKA